MSLQIEKNAGLPVSITAYTEYRYGEQFSFAFGINGLAGALYFKSGWKKKPSLYPDLYVIRTGIGIQSGYCHTLGR